MNVIELHIENQRVDLFNNEVIEMSSSIQNVRDIGRVFTDFTRDFAVPASPRNNKIFKHYHNNSIKDGFDARTKKESVIYINQIQFRRGRIQLLGVDMRNNVPFSYRLVFYGGLTNVTDLFGEDTLSSLRSLRDYDHDYDPLASGGSTMKTGFTTGLTLNSQTNAIIYPLITAEKRLYYQSGTVNATDPDGNLYYYPSNPSTTRGLEIKDLKPAIRCIHIIEAIEERYGIEFTRDFFDDTAFDNLYMWLHRGKGNFFENENENTIPNGKLFLFDTTPTLSSDIALTSISSDNSILEIDTTSDAEGYEHFINLQASTSRTGSWTANATVAIVDDETGRIVAQQRIKINDSANVNFRLPRNVGKRFYSFQIIDVEAVAGLLPTFTYSATLEVGSLLAGSSIESAVFKFGRFDRYTTTSQSASFTGRIQIRNVIPETKITDFLDGLFKMFNLTAYYVDDVNSTDFGKLKVQTLDDYYDEASDAPLGEIVDVTKYVDVESHSVDVALPYSDIEFKYDEPKTLLAEKHLEKYNIEWGSAKYRPLGLDIGSEKYNIKVPFTHLKLERLHNTVPDGAVSTDIMCGYVAGGDYKSETDKTPPTLNYEPQETSPILFYAIRETDITNDINMIGYANDAGKIEDYWRPSNTNEAGDSSTAPAFTLNFDNEIDEWNLTDYEGGTNSLFKNFYKTYIEEVFSESRRMITVTAYLPNSFLLNYRLNNKLRIGDDLYRINSIKSNLLDGKSQLELLSIQE